MPAHDPLTFISLEWGRKPAYRRELRYGLRSLLADVPTARPVIYTDDPDAYGADAAAVQVIDIGADLPAFTRGGAYHFRAKTCVLLDALRRFGGGCALMDTDSFIRPGFAAALTAALAHGAVMNFRTGENPYPDQAGFTVALPHAGHWRYDPADAPVFNSGLVAVTPAHIPALEDALALMDALQPVTAHLRHDQEQFAVGEALRLHGIAIGENRTEFVHYCSTWAKQYMRWRFSRMPGLETAPLVPAPPHIVLRKGIQRAYKAGALLGLLPRDL
jgi:hypothetical protein